MFLRKFIVVAVVASSTCLGVQVYSPILQDSTQHECTKSPRRVDIEKDVWQDRENPGYSYRAILRNTVVNLRPVRLAEKEQLIRAIRDGRGIFSADGDLLYECRCRDCATLEPQELVANRQIFREEPAKESMFISARFGGAWKQVYIPRDIAYLSEDQSSMAPNTNFDKILEWGGCRKLAPLEKKASREHVDSGIDAVVNAWVSAVEQFAKVVNPDDIEAAQITFHKAHNQAMKVGLHRFWQRAAGMGYNKTTLTKKYKDAKAAWTLNAGEVSRKDGTRKRERPATDLFDIEPASKRQRIDVAGADLANVESQKAALRAHALASGVDAESSESSHSLTSGESAVVNEFVDLLVELGCDPDVPDSHAEILGVFQNQSNRAEFRLMQNDPRAFSALRMADVPGKSAVAEMANCIGGPVFLDLEWDAILENLTNKLRFLGY